LQSSNPPLEIELPQTTSKKIYHPVLHDSASRRRDNERLQQKAQEHNARVRTGIQEQIEMLVSTRHQPVKYLPTRELLFARF
jgi:hypothetical protein